MFYPADSDVLRRMVRGFIDEAQMAGKPSPKAVIAPHAGVVYSGAIAGSAYACVKPDGISRVVLLGPTHRVYLEGLAAPETQAWRTPLGDVSIDFQALETVSDRIVFSDLAHEEEHCLEVQLPFLQERLGDAFGLVPMVVGDARPDEVADVLDALWGGPETLIVISSDLSHYLSYDDARRMDSATANAVLALDEHGLDRESACGRNAIRGLLCLAKRRGMRAELLDLRSSGDTAGTKDQVVGYGSFAFYSK